MTVKLPKPFYTARVGEALSSLTNYVKEGEAIATKITKSISAKKNISCLDVTESNLKRALTVFNKKLDQLNLSDADVLSFHHVPAGSKKQHVSLYLFYWSTK